MVFHCSSFDVPLLSSLHFFFRQPIPSISIHFLISTHPSHHDNRQRNIIYLSSLIASHSIHPPHLHPSLSLSFSFRLCAYPFFFLRSKRLLYLKNGKEENYASFSFLFPMLLLSNVVVWMFFFFFFFHKKKTK